mgnify:CR=1 FL=1|jgi:hypothetical protein
MGIMIAAIALLPTIRRQELMLKVRTIDWIVIIFTILLVHYAIFFSFFKFWGFSPGLNLHNYGITPSNLSYFIIICSGIFLLIRIKSYQLKSSNLISFKSLISQLLARRMYTELSLILERNIKSIFVIANLDFPMGKHHTKFKKILDDKSFHELYMADQSGDDLNKLSKFKRNIYKTWLIITPDYSRRATEASDLLKSIMLKREVTEYLAINSPYLGMSLLQNKDYYSNSYINDYFKTLIHDKNSILYFELKNNQNTNEYSYEIEVDNLLLSYLFNPGMNAKKLGVWAPIGEYIETHLANLGKSTSDRHLKQNKDYYEDGKWDSSLFVGISFFDIMIKSALKQNVKWHMWLYFYNFFGERIIKNLKNFTNEEDDHYEWASPYHYLLYIIVSNLCDYIKAIELISIDQENVKLDSIDIKHENGSIVKSSILCLMMIIRKILISKHIADLYKLYLINIPFNVLFTLQKNDELERYFHCLRNAIIEGGFSNGIKDQEYWTELLKCAKKIDFIKYDIDEVNKFILDIKNRIE